MNFLLSSAWATLFTGRTFEIKVYPFSFREYMEYFGLKDRYDALDKYVLEGGMSGSYLYKDQDVKYDYLADVFDTLIVRDIRKKYLSDHSFRYAKLGTKNMDYGRILENIVAVELLRRGYEVYVGILYKKEIDFVAVKRSEKIYIQVSDNISDEKTFEREAAPLLQIKDAYPKYVIARTRHDEYQYEGIKVIDIADWLLDK